MTDQSRLHAMDAFRVLLMLCVIVGHAGLAYSTIPIPDLQWPVHDRMPSYGFDLLLWVLQGFAMPGFFLVSGFWARRQIESNGPLDFLRQRVSKLVVPFLLACLLILPFCYIASATGWLIEGRASLREVLLADFDDPLLSRNLTGPGHLWFLEALIIISVLLTPVLMRLSRLKGGNLLPFMGVTGVLLYFHPEAMFNLHNSFIPPLWRTLHYAVFFLGGAVLFGLKDKLEILSRYWILLTLAAIAAFPFMAWAVGPYIKGEAFEGLLRFSMGAGGALYCWFSVLGVLGFFIRYFNNENKKVRGLSDASYWVYLVHLPIVFMAQIALFPLNLPAFIKFIFVCAIALTFGLLSLKMFTQKAETLSRPTQWTLSVLLALTVIGGGISYQYLYRKEVEQCRVAVTRFYLEYFHRKPDAIGLHYWTTRASTSWGLARVERDGFRLAKERGAK